MAPNLLIERSSLELCDIQWGLQPNKRSRKIWTFQFVMPLIDLCECIAAISVRLNWD